MNFRSIITLVFIVSFVSCKKDCETKNATCEETVPVNEACLAFFTRWFYDEASNKCEQIGYSGCSQKGFATKKECETCLCNK
jgi:hypothetical protein